MSNKTRLYGFTRDWHFPYYCFGKRCYAFKIILGKKDHRLHTFFFKLPSEDVLLTMTANHNPIKFFGFIKTDFNTLYDLFND